MCTYTDSSGSSKRSIPSETAPLSGTSYASETIPQGGNDEEPSSTEIEHTAIPIDRLLEQGAHEARAIVELPTTNQYLLVLTYLFLASRVPYDGEAISRIIARGDKEWEENFCPQYPRLLSWWLTVRGDLTRQGDIPAVSIEDMIQQMRYLLYLIGRLSSQQSGFYSEWESSSHPYRPFGMNASIALICYCFNGTKSVQGYESLDIWSNNEGILFTMLIQLRSSPTFRDRLTSSQLEHMIASLRTTLLGEDNRTYLLPWSVRIDNSDMTLNYYRSAIKALNPWLLPEIQSRWARELPKEEPLTCVQNWDFDDLAMIGMDHSELETQAY
jgi:hypothetical protein